MSWLKNFFHQVFQGESKQDQDPEQENTQEHSPLLSLAVDADYYLSLEEKLLRLDCGIEFTEYVIQTLQERRPANQYQAQEHLQNIFQEVLTQVHNNTQVLGAGFLQQAGRKIIMISGINGGGKTTSIAKLAYFAREQLQQKVLLAPCDTFRAAACEQLKTWSQRAAVDMHLPNNTSQRADSVLFEALQRFQTENYDLLLVDTAGRLQNKKDLMEELARLSRVLDKHLMPDITVTRWLVLDATTGQNGYQQAVAFNEVTPLSGLILSKFDGSAKGGIVFAIAHNLKLPIQFVGTGEKLTDLSSFDLEVFLERLS